jgi:hypothetical protein
VATHTVFGLGLYMAALATAQSPLPGAGLRARCAKDPLCDTGWRDSGAELSGRLT